MRVVAGALVPLVLAVQAAAWSLSFGTPGGNRVAAGAGTFPRWRTVALPTEVPLRWLAAFSPRRIAAVDGDGTFWIFEVGQGGLSVAGRYGEAASPEGPPVVVRTAQGQDGLALIGPDGRLLLWSEGALHSHDVGAPLSRFTFPVPVPLAGRAAEDLLAVARDGAVLLIGGVSSGAPRAISRADIHALPDARITLADLDGDGRLEAVVLSDPTDRYPHGAQGNRLEASSVSVIGVQPWSLEVKARFVLPAPAVFEDRTPILAPFDGGARPAVLLARSGPGQGAAVMALGWREGGLVSLAEGPPLGQMNRWIHIIGAADLSGDGAPEIAAVVTPHIGGVLTAYRRAKGRLVSVARAPGYSSHALGSRNLDQALIADLDGNGVPEVVLPRQSREALAGVELHGGRWVERWSLELKGPVTSNLVAADLDGDGLLDLALADRRGLHTFISTPEVRQR